MLKDSAVGYCGPRTGRPGNSWVAHRQVVGVAEAFLDVDWADMCGSVE
ncbi:hypothetical protein ACWGQ5_22740 [Streptomyces sp. NPDC055722]